MTIERLQEKGREEPVLARAKTAVEMVGRKMTAREVLYVTTVIKDLAKALIDALDPTNKG